LSGQAKLTNKRVILLVKEGRKMDNKSILIEQLVVSSQQGFYLSWKGTEENHMAFCEQTINFLPSKSAHNSA
jgi:hypothetical protein